MSQERYTIVLNLALPNTPLSRDICLLLKRDLQRSVTARRIGQVLDDKPAPLSIALHTNSRLTEHAVKLEMARFPAIKYSLVIKQNLE